MELYLFVASIALCVFCGIALIKRDDTENHRIDNITASVNQNSFEQSQIKQETKAFATTTVTMISDLNKRLEVIEKGLGGQSVQTMNVHMKEPISVKIIGGGETLGKEPKTKTPLLKRAGIVSRASN